MSQLIRWNPSSVKGGTQAFAGRKQSDGSPVNKITALHDADDDTRVYRVTETVAVIQYGLNSIPVPVLTGTPILSEWRLAARHTRDSVGLVRMVGTDDSDNEYAASKATFSGTKSLYTAYSAWVKDTVLPTQIQWVDVSPTTIAPYLDHWHASLAEFYIEALYWTLPAVSSVTPVANIVNAAPLVGWVYTSNEAVGSTAWAYQVYPQSVYSAAGFVPTNPFLTGDSDDTAVAADWNTGDGEAGVPLVLRQAATFKGVKLTLRPPVVLPQGAYRVYVWAAETMVSGSYAWAPAAHSDFAVVGVPPSTPLLALGWASDRQAVQVFVASRVNQVDADSADGEASVGLWVGAAGTLARSGASPLHGSQSFTITATAATTGADAGSFPVTGGHQYRFSVVLGPNANSRVVTPAINWYDGVGAFLSTTSGTPAALGVGGNTAFTVAGRAPVAAASAKFTWRAASATIGEVFKFDQLSKVPIPDGIITSATVPWSPGGYLNPRVQVQRQNQDGTWQDVRRVAGETVSADNAVLVSVDTESYGLVHDYEAIRGQAAAFGIPYRARTIVDTTGATLASDWTTLVASTMSDGRAWLKVLDSPELNVGGLLLARGVQTQQTREQGVFQPIGSPLAKVVKGVVRGQDGQASVYAADVETVDALIAAFGSGSKLLLQEASGDSSGRSRQRYVEVVSPTNWTRRVPPVTFQFSFVEVDSS